MMGKIGSLILELIQFFYYDFMCYRDNRDNTYCRRYSFNFRWEKIPELTLDLQQQTETEIEMINLQ